METFYQSQTVSANLAPAGWLEFNVVEGEHVTYKDIEGVARALVSRGITTIRVLVIRTTSYSTAADVMTSDLSSIAGLTVEKVAYLAPNLVAQMAATIEGRTALRNLPNRPFENREEALAWLLTDQTQPLSAARK